MNNLNQFVGLLDIFIAALLGGVVGFEREWKHKPAGLRTNMIISSASAFFILLGRYVIVDFQMLISDEASGVDPVRMLNAVILGISVLGAGTILKSVNGQDVKYLTTSATILMASAIGMSVALKQYILAIGATVIILIINRVMDYLSMLISRRSNFHEKARQSHSDDDNL